MNIAIVGTGYVGLVSGACFAEMGIDVTCVDINPEKIKCLLNGEIPIYEPGLDDLVKRNVEAGRLHFTTDLTTCLDNVEVVFSAVGTPPDEDGSADLQYVLEVARTFGRNIKKYTILVTKSTVPVGTAKKVKAVIEEELTERGEQIDFEVASNPEFLKEGAAIKDFMSPDRVVVGVESDRAKKVMERLYRPFQMNNYRLYFMDIPSAEMTKYAANAMLATRISFMNDIANLCDLVGANVDMVRKGIGADTRIGSKFLYPGCGYGGSCFPKDTKALHWLANYYDYEIKTIRAAIDVNENQKIRLIKKARKYYESMNGLTVAVLGLTFKPGPDDLRDAPSLQNIPILLDDGAVVRAYDPVGEENFKKKIPEGIIYCDSPEQALLNADICFIFTEWDEVKKLDAEKFEKLMKSPVVLDGRNCYDPESFKGTGVFYESIGRSPVYPAEGYEAPQK